MTESTQIDPSAGDYYSRLGISPDADKRDIRAAGKVASSQYHPDSDTTANSKQLYYRLKDARDTLEDPTDRSQYDLFYSYDEDKTTYTTILFERWKRLNKPRTAGSWLEDNFDPDEAAEISSDELNRKLDRNSESQLDSETKRQKSENTSEVEDEKDDSPTDEESKSDGVPSDQPESDTPESDDKESGWTDLTPDPGPDPELGQPYNQRMGNERTNDTRDKSSGYNNDDRTTSDGQGKQKRRPSDDRELDTDGSNSGSSGQERTIESSGHKGDPSNTGKDPHISFHEAPTDESKHNTSSSSSESQRSLRINPITWIENRSSIVSLLGSVVGGSAAFITVLTVLVGFDIAVFLWVFAGVISLGALIGGGIVSIVGVLLSN